MSMSHKGLVKLSEEAAEVTQVAQKLVAYPELEFDDIDKHPDGSNLRQRLEEEMGDVLAAIDFVTTKLNLASESIQDRRALKLVTFRRWDRES